MKLKEMVCSHIRGIDMVAFPLLLAGLVQTATAAVAAYKVSQISVTGAAATYAQGLNKGDTVVGLYTTSTATEGFRLAGGKYSNIKFPGSNNNTRVFGINDSSAVEHGFNYNGSTYTTIDVPGATFTYGWGINASGEMTVTWGDANGYSEATLYTHCTATPTRSTHREMWCTPGSTITGKITVPF